MVWARATLPVGALLGAPEPPLLLPLATLTSVVAQERLPTLRVGDRHLVYQATIAEAQARGLLLDQRGRPAR